MSFKSLRLPRDSQLVQMNHANYITMLYNWHLKFTKSILTQLESSDYISHLTRSAGACRESLSDTSIPWDAFTEENGEDTESRTADIQTTRCCAR